MPLLHLITPTHEPVSLIEAKTHLRVYATDEDTLITARIAAARARAENETQRSIMAQRLKLVADAFPGPTMAGVAFGELYSLPAHALQIPAGAVLQVVSITYLDMSGVRQTMPAADYAVDLASEPVRITPVFGKIWPIALPQIGAIEVTFDAGHAAPITAVDATADTITVPRWKTLAVGDTLRVFARDVGGLPGGAGVQNALAPTGAGGDDQGHGRGGQLPGRRQQEHHAKARSASSVITRRSVACSMPGPLMARVIMSHWQLSARMLHFRVCQYHAAVRAACSGAATMSGCSR
jgi:uncharacterized phiE125 gp8 family phage protein